MATLTKEMIDIITILRRRINNEFEVPIKLANQDLMADLVGFYHKSTDQLTKELIHEVLTLAGNNWVKKLRSAPKAAPAPVAPAPVETSSEINGNHAQTNGSVVNGSAVNGSATNGAAVNGSATNGAAVEEDESTMQGADILFKGIKRIFSNEPEHETPPAVAPTTPDGAPKRVRRYRGQIIQE